MRKFLIILFFVLSGTLLIQSQSLNVVNTDGIEESFEINGIEKLYFTSGIFMIDQTDGNIGVFLLEEISQVNFTDFTGAVELNASVKEELTLFPNPATEYLTVAIPEVNQIQTLQIQNATGQTVLNRKVEQGETLSLDVSSLQPGLYFCRVYYKNKSVISKFIKK